MIVPTSEQIEAIRKAVSVEGGRLDHIEYLTAIIVGWQKSLPSETHPLLFTCPLGDGLKFAFHTQEQVDMLERHLKVAHGRENAEIESCEDRQNVLVEAAKAMCRNCRESDLPLHVSIRKYLFWKHADGNVCMAGEIHDLISRQVPSSAPSQQESEANQND